MTVFVIEDNWAAGTTVVHDFGSDADAGLDYLQARENVLYPWDGPERVCYFRADSVETLRTTHASWFHRDVRVVEGAAQWAS